MFGTSRTPGGQTLSVNSRYLVLDGKPWLPVMGEFQYSRVPVSDWQPEILKMKASGVQIVSTYVIWIHHEEVQGQFDWSGRRNLRRFVELCAKNGMYVWLRIGPWDHGEVRNGGFPNWLLQQVPKDDLRRDDPLFMKYVRRLYAQIGEQVQGLMWNQGGPVIGVQLSNEYSTRGPEAGDTYILALKKLALASGLHVPIFSVTGWDGAAIPLGQVLPVYSGYPAAPWERRRGKLPPRNVFAFRFHNRAADTMSAKGGNGQNSASAYRGTPFLTAEIGGGIEDTYFRRPVIHPADIASLAPVMLGSGANLLGYYLFQGGRNPQGKLTTLEESQRTGYPTDVPVKSYDFQAPLGEFGQERTAFRRLKLVNYFLKDFGALLAPMTVAAPEEQPASPSDLSVARVSARVSGDRAFLFFNNYVRGVTMPARPGFQVHIHLPSGILKVPGRPISLPTGVYGIWPIHFSLNGHDLIYSTAQLFARTRLHGETLYLFFAIPGITPQFAFATGERPQFQERQVTGHLRHGVVYLDCHLRGRPVAITLPPSHSRPAVRILLLSRTAAAHTWTVDGSPDLVSTPDQYYSRDATLHLLSNEKPVFRFGLLGPDIPSSLRTTTPSANNFFRQYTVRVKPAHPTLHVTFLHPARPGALSASQRKRPVPFAPTGKDFTHAAAWKIEIPWPPAADLGNLFLSVRYTGDVARLYSGKRLLDDNFWNGTTWQLGMRPWRTRIDKGPLRLLVLPAPMHSTIGNTGEGTKALRHKAQLLDITLTPQYQLAVSLRHRSSAPRRNQ